MISNVGGTDRMVRFLLGIVLIGSAATKVAQGIWRLQRMS